VHQPGGAEGMAGPFALELPVGDPMQFPIDQREEPVHRVGSTMTDLEKEVGDRLAIAIGRLFIGCHLAWLPGAVLTLGLIAGFEDS
jgi:hypothetical protein